MLINTLCEILDFELKKMDSIYKATKNMTLKNITSRNKLVRFSKPYTK